jgi:universal stress protein E
MTRDADISMILAAVADPQGKGQVAAPKAVELAHLLGAEVVLYHACYEASFAGGRILDSKGLARARRGLVAERKADLDDLASRLSTEAVTVSTIVEWQKHIPEAVVRAALGQHAGLVVAEPRYRGTRRPRLGLSHTDWELARLCPMPLLLARTRAPYGKPRLLAAVDPGGHGERESQLDVKIVEVAGRLAELSSGSVQVVHALHPAFRALGVPPRALRSERERTRELLRHLALGAGLRASSVRVVEGDPAEALLEVATADGIDLLVMGTFVRGPLQRALFGSTAEQLVNVVPCDVLILKPDGFKSPVPPPTRRSRGKP